MHIKEQLGPRVLGMQATGVLYCCCTAGDLCDPCVCVSVSVSVFGFVYVFLKTQLHDNSSVLVAEHGYTELNQ